MMDPTTFKKRLRNVCLRSQFYSLPRKLHDRHVLFHAISMTLDAETLYTEVELNDALKGWLAQLAPEANSDHVTLRRALVDYRYLVRDTHGRQYQINPEAPASPLTMAPEVAQVDVRSFLTQAIQEETARRAQARARYVQPSQD